MNPHSKKYNEPLPHIEDEPMNETLIPPATHKLQTQPRKPFLDRLKTCAVIVSEMDHLAWRTGMLIFSLFFISQIFYTKIQEPRRPGSLQVSSFHSGPITSPALNLAWKLPAIVAEAVASNLPPGKKQSGRRVESRYNVKEKQSPRPFMAKTEHPSNPPEVQQHCSGQPVPQFRTRIGVPYSLRCKSGQWRVHEVTPVASIASTWGDAPASER